MRILVIDDSNLIHSFIHTSLTAKGINIVDAENGKEGISLLKQGEKFDIILLDWNMPEMDGPTFLEQVAQNNLVDCPIVMMTTENSPQKIMRAMSLGATEYIMKPFDKTILVDKIELVLQKKIPA